MSIDGPEICVDDTDPQIQWNGPWFSTQDYDEDIGGNGSPFLSTLHGISSNGSLTFSFYGGWVALWGSLTVPNSTLDWRCLIDGSESEHPFPPAPYAPVNNYPFCMQSLAAGNHTLQFNAIVRSETLYIDVIRYAVAPATDVGSAWVNVHHSDARFNYSSDWTTHESGYWKWTYRSGAWLTYDFHGSGVVWGGYTPRNSRVGPGKGRYQIDGGELKTFTIPQASRVSLNNQAYFNVTGLRPGPHRLTVTNAGDESTAALGINFITTKNEADTTTGGGGSGKVIGAAVGGSIGAVLLAVLCILAFIWYRRRQRQREHDAPWMGGTTLGKAMSITSGSTDIKELHTPVSPTQGPWSQPAGFLPHQHSTTTTSNGERSPTNFVAPPGPYQPAASPSGPNSPTRFTTPPNSNRPTVFVTPSNPRLQRGSSASSGMAPPTSIAGSQSPVSFTASPSGSSPPPPTFINPNNPTAAGTPSQQNVWPMQVPVPIIQEEKHDYAAYYPIR